MAELFLFSRGMALGMLLLLCLKVWLQCRQFVAGRLMLLLFVGLAGYMVAPFFATFLWLKYIAVTLAITVPVGFWLFAEALFNDWDSEKRRVSITQYLVFVIYLLIALSAYWFNQVSPSAIVIFDTALASVLFYLSYLFRLTLTVLAFFAIVSRWRTDLVEPRRRLRSILVVLGAIQILLVTVVELVLGQVDAPLQLELLNSLILLGLIMAIATWLLLIQPDSLPVLLGISNPVAPAVASTSITSALAIPENSNTTDEQQPDRLKAIELGWLKALNQHMEVDAGYRDTELTIRTLSKHIAVPEHRLRQLINQHLGYRNFNEYLNRFRIAEAASRLADPEQEHLPILTVAMEVGYGSLTPFNRAFKLQFDQTPSQFRREKIA